MAKATSAQLFGTSNADDLNLATKLYSLLEAGSIDGDYGQLFQHLICWELVKNYTKFDHLRNLSISSTISPATDDDHCKNRSGKNENEEFKRPIEQKHTKTQIKEEEFAPERIKVTKATLQTQQ